MKSKLNWIVPLAFALTLAGCGGGEKATTEEKAPAAPAATTTVDPATAGEISGTDRKSTRLNSSHIQKSRMPSSA